MRSEIIRARPKRYALTLLLALSALVLGGCLGGPELEATDPVPTPEAAATTQDNEVTAAVLAAAATKTGATGSAKLAMTLSMKLPGAAERVEISLKGAFDLAKQRGRLSFDYAGLLEALGPEGQQVKAFLPNVMLLDGTTIYLRMPNLAQVLPGAKPWVKLDANELGQQQGFDVTGVDQLAQSDPAQLLALLEVLNGPIEDLGPDKVRGQDSTHYRATLDLTKVAGAVPAERQGSIDVQIQQLQELGLDSMPIDVWIDGEGRVNRMSSSLAIPDTGTGAAGNLDWNIELFDFGAKVKINPPAKKKTTSVDKLLGAIAPTVQG